MALPDMALVLAVDRGAVTLTEGWVLLGRKSPSRYVLHGVSNLRGALYATHFVHDGLRLVSLLLLWDAKAVLMGLRAEIERCYG